MSYLISKKKDMWKKRNGSLGSKNEEEANKNIGKLTE